MRIRYMTACDIARQNCPVNTWSKYFIFIYLFIYFGVSTLMFAFMIIKSQELQCVIPS